MAGERTVLDGLWRCLCPAVDATTLSRPFVLPTRRITLPCPNSAVQAPTRRAFRISHSTRSLDKSSHSSPDDQTKVAERTRIGYIKRVAKRSSWVPGSLLRDERPLAAELERRSTRDIYQALNELQHVEGSYLSIVRLVDYLVRERGERPSPGLYEYLIRANVCHKHGSAAIARGLWKEMASLDMPIPVQVYEALLEVTAVHPDYAMRSSVLRDMRHRWYSPTLSGLVSIIIGLLRGGHHEQALEKLEELYKAPVVVPPWLYNIFLYTFGELGYHDEAFSILQHQLKIYGPNQSHLSWLFLLEVFSRDDFYSGIAYIWERMVVPGLINPPDGVVLNVLNSASRHGDVAIALSVIQTLTNRGRKIDLHHYEALVDAHVRNNQLQEALWVLCIMNKAGIRPDSSSTRSIYRWLRQSKGDTVAAVDRLHKLSETFEVPIAAFNVVLEATVPHCGFQAGLDLYRSVRHICSGGPNLATYHAVLPYCTRLRSARFLFLEMRELSIVPDRAIFDHMVRIAASESDYLPAFRYLDMMVKASRPRKDANGVEEDPAKKASGWWISRDTALVLIRRCVEAKDVRIHEVVDGCRKHGLAIDGYLRMLMQDAQRRREQIAGGTDNAGSEGDDIPITLSPDPLTSALTDRPGEDTIVMHPLQPQRNDEEPAKSLGSMWN